MRANQPTESFDSIGIGDAIMYLLIILMTILLKLEAIAKEV